jgi:hypothetical protein
VAARPGSGAQKGDGESLSSAADRSWVRAIVIALGLSALSFALQHAAGLDLADEGYLWYGAQRVLAGELPLRDFQSYDPGRYYFTAPFLAIFGNGLFGLRLALAAAQAIGLACGLLCLSRVRPVWGALFPAGVVLLLWAVPRHKAFEPAMALVSLLIMLRLLERPSPGRHLQAGLLLGALLFFGRNFALYAGVGLVVVLILIAVKLDRTKLSTKALALGAGVLLGVLPLFVLLTRPGFAAAYRRSVTVMAATINLAVPVPWPWRIDWSGPWPAVTHAGVVSVAYVSFVLLPLVLAPVLWRISGTSLERHRVAILGAILAATHAHHAFARADVSHLAQAYHPALVALLSGLLICHTSTVIRGVTLGVAVAASAFGPGVLQPAYAAQGPAKTELTLANDRVSVANDTAAVIRLVDRISQEQSSEPRWFLAPDWPGLYAARGQRSPTWDIYFLFSQSEDVERQQIAELEAEHVGWALLLDQPRDGRDDRRLSRIQPVLWRYLHDQFDRVERADVPVGCELLRRTTRASPAPGAQ